MRNLYLRLAANIGALIGAGVLGGILVARAPGTANAAEYFFWGPALALAVTVLATSLALRSGRYRSAIFDYSSNTHPEVAVLPPILLAGCGIVLAAGLLIRVGVSQELLRLAPAVIAAYFGGIYGKELWKADSQ